MRSDLQNNCANFCDPVTCLPSGDCSDTGSPGLSEVSHVKEENIAMNFEDGNNRKSHGTPPPEDGKAKKQKQAPPKKHERVRYTKQENGVTRWDVIFEIVDGEEKFYARESWESGLWHKYNPSASEVVTAREIMALERAKEQWEKTAPEEERVYVMIADLGRFPQCIHQAIHELRKLLVDGTDGRQIERLQKVLEHSARGEWLIKQVFDWFEEHRKLRGKVHTL